MLYLLGVVFIAGVAHSQGIDPFELKPEDLLITQGPLQGESVSGTRRPVLILSLEEQKALGLGPPEKNEIRVANFFDQSKMSPDRKSFHIASIRLDKIKSAGFEVMDRTKYNHDPEDEADRPVKPKLLETGPRKYVQMSARRMKAELMEVGPHKHVQMYVEFDSPIELYTQEVDPKTGRLLNLSPVMERNWLGYAVGAERPKEEDAENNKKFKPGEAMSGAYKKVQFFVGEHEAHRDMNLGQQIDRFQVDLPPQEVGELLKMAATESTALRLSQPYHGMSSGCLSTVLRYLDAIKFGEPLKQFPHTWPSSLKAIVGEFLVRKLKVTRLSSLIPENMESKQARARARFDKGEFGPENPQIHTQISRLVGNCASLISQASVRAQIIINGK